MVEFMTQRLSHRSSPSPAVITVADAVADAVAEGASRALTTGRSEPIAAALGSVSSLRAGDRGAGAETDLPTRTRGCAVLRLAGRRSEQRWRCHGGKVRERPGLCQRFLLLEEWDANGGVMREPDIHTAGLSSLPLGRAGRSVTRCFPKRTRHGCRA